MTTEVDDFLAHYGVSGMKWGVRRASDSVRSAVKRGSDKRKAKKDEIKANTKAAKAAGYSSSKRLNDLNNVGRNGTRRIEKRIANGESIGKARVKEYARSTGTGLAVGAGVLAVTYGPKMADRAAGNLASHINAKRGAEVARNLFADNKGLTSYSVVSLAFDKAKGSYG